MSELISKELLSLILYEDIKYLETDINKIKYNIRSDIKENEIIYHLRGSWIILNLDTLTRLMIKKIKEYGYMVTVYYHDDTVAVSVSNDEGRRYSSPSMTVYSEQEAIKKALEWVAKEKGLL